MTEPTAQERGLLRDAYSAAREELLSLRAPGGWWEGELSSSALSTAVASSALSVIDADRHSGLVADALGWLVRDQNSDGGWGDTPESPSNLPTTMLVRAALRLGGGEQKHASALRAAEGYLAERGGATPEGALRALEELYAPDRTFAIPILCNLALAGLVEWRTVPSLPFELAALPQGLYRFLRMEVVSYALPALIAVGQLLHARGGRGGPVGRLLRRVATRRTLRKLEQIQPEGGGFIEAVPLTGFVVMSLAGAGRPDHPVARRGVEFLEHSRRLDGSWPIDSNLSVWVTTGAVAAISASGVYSGPDRDALRTWLVGRQHASRHPFTGARPGGWAWTHLPGGVPDADDTSGALIALWALQGEDEKGVISPVVAAGLEWLLEVQNSDGGWPTFCRGWGRLPFDRSAADITAHAMRAIGRWAARGRPRRVARALERGFACLEATQRPGGEWVPLWFGNQFAPGSENPVYGTARVLAAYRDLGAAELGPAKRGAEFLLGARNSDGGWGGAPGVPSTIEETAVAVEALAGLPEALGTREAALAGALHLAERVKAEGLRNPSPIGVYFARLWYAERLYPAIWTVGALGRLLVTESVAGGARAVAGTVPTDGRDD